MSSRVETSLNISPAKVRDSSTSPGMTKRVVASDESALCGHRSMSFLLWAFRRNALIIPALYVRDGGPDSPTLGSRGSPFQNRSHGNRFVAGTVDFEESAADFSQTFLGEREVLMQAVFKDVANGRKTEVVT